jgi:GntR family transcriptional regulator/MocR family aminotransferase
VKAIAALRKVIDVQGDNVMEHAIAELMEEGAILKHARKAYTVYKERWENMDRMLVECLGNKVNFSKPEGGLAFWVRLNEAKDTNLLAGKLLTKGVSVIPTEPFSVSGKPLNALRLGYAALTEEELKSGLSIINKLL